MMDEIGGKRLEIIGRNVKRLRDELGWSQEILAERAKLSQTYISLLECGRRGIRWPTLTILAKTLGKTELDILISRSYDDTNLIKIVGMLEMLRGEEQELAVKFLEILINKDIVEPNFRDMLKASITAVHQQIKTKLPT